MAGRRRGLSASQSGLILLGVFGTALIVSSTTGRRKEIRGKLVVGSIAQITMCLLLLPLHATTAIWLLVLVAAVAGIPPGSTAWRIRTPSIFRPTRSEWDRRPVCCGLSCTSAR